VTRALPEDELERAAEAWRLADPDEATREELAGILARGDRRELVERFSRSLEFGTAGLRGLMGAGPNRMNRAVVIRTSAGLVASLLEELGDAAERGIVVGYDARRQSRTFADDAASVFAAAGVRVHWFPDVVPTPLVAFAVRHLRAAAGVVVTASHNPAEYNGYKVYWSNGAQIVPPRDHAIAHFVAAVPAANLVPRVSREVGIAEGRIRSVPREVEAHYLSGIRELLLAPRVRPELSVVYTPLHGVGFALVNRAMKESGFGEMTPVPEQVEPDPGFPTAPFPNPEEKGVLDRAVALARKSGADLVLANDPDADRLAVAVRNDAGEFVQLSGNQVGVLIGHYLLTADPRRDARAVIASIVSSPMLGEIARQLGVHYEETFTGFKWIANRAMELTREGKRFVFGYEEALGYCIGDLVRDKDGVSAAVLFAEIASVCRQRGSSVFAYLCELYRRYGLYASRQRSVILPGIDGAARIDSLMKALRESPPDGVGARRVIERRDYAARLAVGGDGSQSALRLPQSDVLAYALEGDTRVIVRPSGTEPKIKCYFDHREPVAQDEPIAAAEQRASSELVSVEQALVSMFPLLR